MNDILYSEDNVQLIFDNIQNYCKLIDEFEKGTKIKKQEASNNELDRLREDIKYKLENFKKENCMTTPGFIKAKNEAKGSSMGYDETIKKLADVIVTQVSSNNLMSTQGKFKKKK